MLGLVFWKVSCAAEGDAHGSVDSWPEQAKLQNDQPNSLLGNAERVITIESPGPAARVGPPIRPSA